MQIPTTIVTYAGTSAESTCSSRELGEMIQGSKSHSCCLVQGKWVCQMSDLISFARSEANLHFRLPSSDRTSRALGAIASSRDLKLGSLARNAGVALSCCSARRMEKEATQMPKEVLKYSHSRTCGPLEVAEVRPQMDALCEAAR